MIKFDKVVQTANKHKWSNTCEYILLHHTGGWSYEWNIKTLSVSTWDKAVSCHYVVAQDWRIAKIGNDTDILWHCWESYWEWKTNMNKYCIGIEVINVDTNFTDAQRESVRNLVSYLMSAYSIPSKNIIRHKDIAPKRKVDIYDSFRNNKYLTFKDYQMSFNTTFAWVEEAKIAIAKNWELRHATDNNELKLKLQELNNLIRTIYNLPK